MLHLPFQFEYLYFSLLITVAETSYTILNRIWVSRHPYLFPEFNKKAFQLFVPEYCLWVYVRINVMKVKVKVKVTQSCPTFCHLMDYEVHGNLQAKIPEWVAISFSRGSSQSRDRTQVSHIAGRFSIS